MTHYKKLLGETGERETLGAWDLTDERGQPRDVRVTIAGVEKGTVPDPKSGAKKQVYLIRFQRGSKKLVLGPTIGDSIAAAVGSADTGDWVGQAITLRPGLTTVNRDVVECVRVVLTDEQMASPHMRGKVRAKLLADRRLSLPTARVTGDPRGDMPRVDPHEDIPPAVTPEPSRPMREPGEDG